MQLITSTSTKESEQKHTADNKVSEANNTPEALQSLTKPKRGRPPAKMKAPVGAPSAPIPKSANNTKRKCTASDTTDEGDDNLEGPSKEKRGWPPAKKKVTEIVAPKAGKPASGDAKIGDPKPVVWRGKVLPPRSPQAGRKNWNTHPGIITASKPKRSSAEVAAAAKRKADLQRQADELEQRQIETLAEMELQEELDEEAEEYFVVRKRAEASSLDDAEDVKMQPEDGEEKGSSVDEADIELSDKDDETEVKGKVAPKWKQVWFFQVCTDMSTVTEVWWQWKKKAVRGETRAAVDKVKASLKAAGKKKGVELTMGCV